MDKDWDLIPETCSHCGVFNIGFARKVDGGKRISTWIAGCVCGNCGHAYLARYFVCDRKGVLDRVLYETEDPREERIRRLGDDCTHESFLDKYEW